MPSPFPGMNPYLEQPGFWPDFHQTYLTLLRLRLGAAIGPRYFTHVETALYVETGPPRRRQLFGVADLSVGVWEGGAVAVADPAVSPAVRATVPVPGVARRQRWVAVRDAQTREIVTVVELLSPANKSGTGRGAYLQKRERVLGSRANLVELDLLRAGQRMPTQGSPAADYSVLVSRPADRPGVDVWPVPLRGSLPAIRFPLRPGDAEPVLDLQALLHETYDGARYAPRLYETPPDPSLAPEDAAWAAGVLAGG